MVKTNIFSEDLQEAVIWERALRPKLEKFLKEKALKVLGSELENVAYEKDPNFQRDRGNYKLERKCLNLLNDDEASYELKVRDYKYYEECGDILLETVSVVEKDEPGWALHSSADMVFYVWKSQDGGDLVDGYILLLQEIKDWFRRNKNQFEVKYAKSRRSEGENKRWRTKNRAVPVSEFPEGTIYNFDPSLTKKEKEKLEELLKNYPVEGRTWLTADEVKEGDVLTIKGNAHFDDRFEQEYLVVTVIHAGSEYSLRVGKRNARRISKEFGTDATEWAGKKVKVAAIQEYKEINAKGMILEPFKKK